MNEIKDGVIIFKDKSLAYKIGATSITEGRFKAILTERTARQLGENTLAKNMEQFRNKVCALKNKTTDPEHIYHENLRPYQNIDVEVLSNIKQKGVFNAMRCGKTPTTIVSAVTEGYKKILVVVPSFLKYQWHDEFLRWSDFTEEDVVIVNGTQAKRLLQYYEAKVKEKYVAIVSYDTAKLDYKKYLKLGEYYDAMIVDEAHFLRNLKSDRTKAIFSIGKNVPVRYALTGTPAVQHPKDIYGILKFLYPDRFKSVYQFCDQFFERVFDPFAYGNYTYGDFKPYMEEDLQNYLSCMSVQRQTKDVMKWLPKITHQTITLDMTAKQQKLYNQMRKEFVAEIDGKEIDAQNALVQATRLNQLSICPEIFGTDVQSSKVNFVVDYVKENPLEPIIIFSSYTSALKIIHEKIKGSVLLTGEQTAEQKKANVDAFQSGETNVLLANIQAGSVGWTIDRANTMIFLNRSFIPVDNKQAEARFLNTRPDMEEVPKTIIDLVNNNSKDLQLLDVYQGKLSLIQVINEYYNEK